MINFADNDKMEIIDSDRVVGSIFKLYEEVTSFVAKSNYAWLEKPSQPNAERIDHYFVDDIAEVVSRWTGIPVSRMMQSESIIILLILV